jgi:type II restriction/modification system DNA methylase subunit YeeA
MLVGDRVEDLRRFVGYAHSLEGDEKGEAQVFCDRLFQAFGHEGYKEAGATLEYRVREKGKRTKFADLLWRQRLLLEMKARGEMLQLHYRQAFDYWLKLVPQRPRYVVLCNFDEFWIYDFDLQLEDPVDKVALDELPERYTALNFLFPDDRKPQFGNNRVDVTRAAADKVARVFNSAVARGESREVAQRFVLQCVVALFSEDFGLLPQAIFTELVQECRDGASTYDLIGSLVRQMGDPKRARAGRFKDVPYFNGGIFKEIEPVELNPDEVELLADASSENWGKVQPQIFGTLFQSSMGKAERHAYGAHFTSEADVQKIVAPTIVRPWMERVEGADRLHELLELRQELASFRVLDPACGAGDFLYVAYRELKRIEMDVLSKIHARFSDRTRAAVGTASLVSPRQFFGIELNPFGVELAKITLVLAKELALRETQLMIDSNELNLPLDFLDAALPLDNLDANIRCEDALFTEWPDVDAIVGNPPFQSKNKMQQEYGAAYVARVRDRYPEVSGRADYCVYWFRRAHDELEPGERAGLVGTNTIRQNYSREGSLDYIVQHGGTITEAVSSQVWSGEAAVHVSLVNWVKGDQPGTKRLYRQLGDRKDSDFEMVEVDRIGAALSGRFDVTGARRLRTNMESGACYQGQTHGHEGFVLDPDGDPDATREVMADVAARPFVHPYLIAYDLLASRPPSPQRYVIDLNRCPDLFAAMKSGKAYQRLERLVMPAMEAKANEEREKTGKDTGPSAQSGDLPGNG